jgi:hypothetical protein
MQETRKMGVEEKRRGRSLFQKSSIKDNIIQKKYKILFALLPSSFPQKTF